MHQELHFKIPTGNAFQMRLLLTLEDGTQMPADILSDIHMIIGLGGKVKEYETTTDGEYIIADIHSDLALGAYDVHVEAKVEDRNVAAHYKALFEIVQWGMAIPQDHVECRMVIIGVSDAETEAIRAKLRAKIAEAQDAKAAADAEREKYTQAIEDLDDVAKESTSKKISDNIGSSDKAMTIHTQNMGDFSEYTGTKVSGGKTYHMWKNDWYLVGFLASPSAVKAGDMVYMDEGYGMMGYDLVSSVDKLTAIGASERILEKMDEMLAAVSLTEEMADEDWNNTQPIQN